MTEEAISDATKEAVARGDLWAMTEYNTSPPYMPAAAYNAEYLTRVRFHNKQIMDQAQQVTRSLFCPACAETNDTGAITASKLFITIEDDVMTVFKAVGHFLCHNCGWEEFHPMQRDPRAEAFDMGVAAAEAAHSHNPPPFAGHSHQGIGKAIGQGHTFGGVLNNRGGVLPAAMKEEREALIRLYANAVKKGMPARDKILDRLRKMDGL